MGTLQANRPIIAAQFAIVAAATFGVLYLTKEYVGRDAFLLLGLALLAFAGFALLRLRK